MKKKIGIIGVLCVIVIGILVFQPLDSNYDGIWITEGYDILFDINKGKVTTYQISGMHLIPYAALDGKIKDGVLETEIIELSLKEKDNKISAVNSLNLEIFKMTKIKSITDYSVQENTQDPFINFEIFWQVFESNYPYFEKYDVDWDLQKENYYEMVQENTTTEELVDIFKSMIADINDDHVYIAYKESKFTPYRDEPKWHKDNNSKELVQVIEKKYIDGLEISEDRLIRHGHLSDKIGYILIASFGGYTLESESIEALEASFTKALIDLKDTDSLVLDLRFNRGGYDSSGIALANHLVTEEKTAYKRHIKNGEVYTELNEIYLTPSDVFYDKEIIILTSGATVSAAETFILAIKDLDNVMIIGEETSGFFSDMLERELPNGMTFGLSHMKYYSSDDQLMEGIKLQPEVNVPIDLKMMTEKKDLALEWILKNRD